MAVDLEELEAWREEAWRRESVLDAVWALWARGCGTGLGGCGGVEREGAEEEEGGGVGGAVGMGLGVGVGGGGAGGVEGGEVDEAGGGLAKGEDGGEEKKEKEEGRRELEDSERVGSR